MRDESQSVKANNGLASIKTIVTALNPALA